MPDGGFQIGRTIALVGLMGSGKSIVGRRLAKRLGHPFVDSDTEIERNAGMSITEIFERHGEEAFRRNERDTIFRLLETPPRVIATGGGAFADEATRRRLLDEGLTIWLDVPIPILIARLAGDERRPLLRGEDPDRRLEDLFAERCPYYALADLHVECADLPPERIVDRIVPTLECHG